MHPHRRRLHSHAEPSRKGLASAGAEVVAGSPANFKFKGMHLDSKGCLGVDLWHSGPGQGIVATTGEGFLWNKPSSKG